MNRMHLVYLSGVFLQLSTAAAAPLDDTEQDLAAAIDGRMDKATALLEQTVNINSGTMNFEGVEAVGRVFQSEFDELGFATRWIPGEDFDRAGHLYAEHMGKEGSTRILLIGHLDTVFEPDSPFQRFERRGERAAGPGTTDMKGGNVVMLEALRALRAVDVLDELSIRVVLTGDEEKRGKPIELATAILVEAAEWADAAIGFEDGDGNPETAVIARRGASGWKLRVGGRPAHSSQVFREGYGYGAIYEAARILDGFRRELADEPNLTFNPGVIVGGTEVELDSESARGSAFGKTNVIAETVLVHGDLRAVSPEQLELARETMRAVVGESLPETGAEIEFLDSYPPMAPSPGNRRLLAIYDQASRDLGFGEVRPVDPRNAGAADISFAAAHVDLALDGIGLMGEGGHTVDEVADLTTLPMQAKRAALLLYRLRRLQ